MVFLSMYEMKTGKAKENHKVSSLRLVENNDPRDRMGNNSPHLKGPFNHSLNVLNRISQE